MPNNIKKLIIGLVVALVVWIAVINIFSIERIDAGHEGVKVNLVGSSRGVQDVTEVSGWVVYNDLTTAIYETPLYERQIDFAPFQVTTRDNAVFTIDPTITYNVVKGMSPAIFSRFRKPVDQLEPTILYQVIKDATRISANVMSSDSLMSNRGVFENNIQLRVTESYMSMGFKLGNFTSGLTPPASLTQAIEAKNVAIQNAIKYTNEAKAETEKAKIAVAQAKGSAEAEVAKAEGRYKAAVFDAKAQDAKAKTLTPLMVEMARIQKWDGSVPTYTGGGSTPIIDLRAK